jgi:hypothetical protein
VTASAPSVEPEVAERMAETAIDNVGREYPNAPGHLLRSAEDLVAPSHLHPSFFGSYDWHSSVHQHWLLVRLLRLGLVRSPLTRAAMRAVLAASLHEDRLAVEAGYLRDHPPFERTYGWAWLLALADEVGGLADSAADADAGRWREALEPAVGVVRTHWLGFLPRATYPIRAGTHANSAFGLALALDHSRSMGDRVFSDALESTARTWFAGDAAYPAHLEPGGDDFLSGALMEAALMSRLLAPAAFARWFAAFLPKPPPALLEPAVVTDRSDPKLAHLDGLNWSRAWCWRVVAAGLAAAGSDGADGPGTAATAMAAAERHAAAARPHLFSGEYVGEHWVATFALLALTVGVGPGERASTAG